MRQRKNFFQERKQFQTKSRWDVFPLGIFSGICLVITLWMFFTVSPSSVRDVIWPQSYLPLLLFIWLTLTSGLMVILLHTRRAILLSFFACLLCWLRFQGALQWQTFFYLVIPFIITEVILTFPRQK